MNINDLKSKIISCNKAYREGISKISDAEYDVLLSNLEDEMNFIEFEAFKKTLMDGVGTITLDYVIGSLKKVKYEDSEDIIKWIVKHRIKELFVSNKVDGCSAVVSYRGGDLEQCTSRGDGETGTDWTEKAKHIVATKIPFLDNLDIRGEFTLTSELFEYKNRRNGTVGIMNNDNPPTNKLNAISFIAYEILNSNDTIEDQFEILRAYGFETPFDSKLVVDKNINERLKEYYNICKKNCHYDIDGLVISPPTYRNEHVYYPETKIAFKVNSEGVHVKVTGIEWNISKGGLLKPVVLIEPTDIDGSTIGRVTGNNAQWVEQNEINEGAVVSVIKSGCVIPKIIEVVKDGPCNGLPTVCPCCGNALKWKSVDLVCDSADCGDKQVKEVASFLIKCGVENATDKSLTNWNIATYDDLLSFEPDHSSKSQCKFASELTKNVFSKTKEELFSCMTFDGAGSTNINKLIEHFGNGELELATRGLYLNGELEEFPEGIGQKVVDKIEKNWKENLYHIKKIVSDPRWKPVVKVVTVSTGNLSGKTFLLTGTLSEGRSSFEKKIKDNGGVVASSVSKTLSYLLCGDNAGSKLDKANKLGVKVITEEEFSALLN